MYVNEDHDEAPDDTGYFRKSGWHDGFCERGSKLRVLIIEGRCEKPSKAEIFTETIKLVKRLIQEENIALGQYNGLAAHKAFSKALQTYEWDDNFQPYLNVMCNFKQYLDRQYAVKFFYENGRDDLAKQYEKIIALCRELAQQIPQDFSAGNLFSDRTKLKPYCDTLLKICDFEEKVISLIG